MTSFMDRFWGKKSSSPAQSAKDRLKFVLVADRTTLAPEELNQMQSEILEVIRKYCRIREDDVELKFEQRERESFLVADIPLSSMRPGEPGGSVRIETNVFAPNEDTEAFPQPSVTKPHVHDTSEDTQPERPPTIPPSKLRVAEDIDEEDTIAFDPTGTDLEKVDIPTSNRAKVSGAPTGMKSEDTAPPKKEKESDEPDE